MKKRKNIVLEKVLVEDYAAEGKSLARVEGKVIFIERVVPGDIVDIRLGKNKKDWAEAHPLRFHAYSPDRVEPFCAHFGVCGGCQWQMLPYERQLAYKQQQVEQALRRIGKVEIPALMPIVGAEDTRYYRNKLEYTFSTRRYVPGPDFDPDAEQSVTGAAGFHARGFFDKVVEVDTCHLQPEPTNQIRKAIEECAKQQGLTFYDFKAHTGFLRNVMVRISRTGQVMVNLVLGNDDSAARSGLLNYLLEKVPAINTLLFTINTKLNDSIYDLSPQVYTGEGYIIETLEGFQFRIGPKSFFQTNTCQGERLYQVTRDFAELTGKETVYDLYCGTGSIGIFVSQGAARVIGVEVVEEAIVDARINAEINGIAHAKFFAGDVIKVCDDGFFATHGRPDVIITDPPRAGMHEKLVRKILDMEAPVVVYVSCNPATQARDLQWLDEKYAVTKVQPVDMFPHTHHIENVVQLKLKSLIANE